jgi:hypothetical protein
MADEPAHPSGSDPRGDGGARLSTMLDVRLRREEARIRRDEARLAADERILTSNRYIASMAAVLAGLLVLAVAGLVVALMALHRDVDVVARAVPKDDSVGTAALQDRAVTAGKLAAGSVARDALVPGAIGPRQLAAGSVTASRVAGDGLTGEQIDEQTLATVPGAVSALRAEDARRLAGRSSSAYLSGVTTRRAASSTDTVRTKGPVVAQCPAGRRIVGGGAAVDGVSSGVAIVRSAPDADDWVAVASAYGRTGAAWRLVVTAICAAGGR